MDGYTLTQDEYKRLKTRLTRVINKGDHDKIIAEVEYAESIFEDKGYPDLWMNWERAREDAKVAKRYAAVDAVSQVKRR